MPGFRFLSAWWKHFLAYFQYNLGMMCENSGREVQNYAGAAKWYEKAAENGNAQAQFRLGLMYYNAQGVCQDYTAARSLWEKAAAQEHSLAQYNLGVMYNNGEGVFRDLRKAQEWYGRACENGLQQGCVKYRELNWTREGAPAYDDRLL